MSVRGVFRMTGYEKLAPVRAIYTPALPIPKAGSVRISEYLRGLPCGGCGNIKRIVKPRKMGYRRLQVRCCEYAEHFRVQRIPGLYRSGGESGSRRPADIKRGRNVRTRPIKYFGYLVPVGHFLKVHLLHGGSVTIIPSCASRHILSKSVEKLSYALSEYSLSVAL